MSNLLFDICVHVHGVLLEGELSARYLHGAGEHCLQGQRGQGDDSINCHIICDASVNCGGGGVHLGGSENINDMRRDES